MDSPTFVFKSYQSRIKFVSKLNEQPLTLKRMLFKRVQLNTMLGNLDENFDMPFRIRVDQTLELEIPKNINAESKINASGIFKF